MSSVSFRGEDRAAGILLLAGSLEDAGHFLFDPRGALQGKTPRGFAPNKKIPCPDCTKPAKKGAEVRPGWVADRFGRFEPCEMCGGKHETWVPFSVEVASPNKGGKGWVYADEANDGPVVVQTTHSKAVPTKQPRTRTCVDCDGDGALPNGRRCKTCKGEGRIVADGFVLADDQARVEKDPLDRYEEAIARRDKSGSYREFVEVEAQVPFRALFRQVYVQVPPRPLLSLSEGERGQLRRSVRFMLEWMPAEVRVPRWVVEADDRARAQPVPKGRGVKAQAREVRDAEIRVRFRQGEDVRSLASWAGLSVGRVNEIVYQEREVA